MKVRDILLNKGETVYTVGPKATVLETLKLMADKNIGSIPVIEGDALLGIFTERDYARKIILKGKFSKDIPVDEVMHETVTVKEEDDIGYCMKLMTDKFVRHLPVIRQGKLAGIISIGDVVKAIISEQEFVINNLSNYIAGTR